MKRLRFIFIILWLLLLYLESYLEMPIFAQLRYSLIILVIASGIILLRQRARVIVEFGEKNIKSDIDETVSFPLVLDNDSLFPIARVKIVMELKSYFWDKPEGYEIEASVGGKQMENLELHYTFKHCGRVTANIKKVVIYDWLGIFCFQVPLNKEESEIIVLPQEEHVSIDIETVSLQKYEENDFFSEKEQGATPPEILEIRPFREGDKLQKIHWKLSVKKDEWFVKEFELPRQRYAVVFLDYFVKDEDESDEVLTNLLGCLKRLEKEDINTFVLWFDEQSKQFKRNLITEEMGANRIVEDACRLTPQDKRYYPFYRQSRPGQNVILISA